MLNLLKKISFWLFLLFLGACARDHITGKSSYNWFQLQDEVGLGQQVMTSQMQAFTGKKVAVDADPVMVARLKAIVQRVAKVSHLPDLPYEVHLADVPVVNAWCAPGGKVMVFTGLWDEKKGLVNMQSDDEIAAVLAHEIAHATARHVTETLSRNMTIALAGTAASGAISAAGSSAGSDLFGQVFSTGFNIYAPSYSRKNEAEADRIGIFYMAKAGYAPEAAVRVWKRAAQKKGDKASLFASHPSNGERARQLELYLPLAENLYRNPSQAYPNFVELPKLANSPKNKPTEH